jgi:hypothetical protein
MSERLEYSSPSSRSYPQNNLVQNSQQSPQDLALTYDPRATRACMIFWYAVRSLVSGRNMFLKHGFDPNRESAPWKGLPRR